MIDLTTPAFIVLLTVALLALLHSLRDDALAAVYAEDAALKEIERLKAEIERLKAEVARQADALRLRRP